MFEHTLNNDYKQHNLVLTEQIIPSTKVWFGEKYLFLDNAKDNVIVVTTLLKFPTNWK